MLQAHLIIAYFITHDTPVCAKGAWLVSKINGEAMVFNKVHIFVFSLQSVCLRSSSCHKQGHEKPH